MPEGVECLLVSEDIKKWCSDQDSDQDGIINFTLDEVLSNSSFKYSPIHHSRFNELFRSIRYKDINTFGKHILIPNQDNSYMLSIQLGMTANFTIEETPHTRIIFSSDYQNLCFNDIRKFGNLYLFDKLNVPPNFSRLLKISIEWRNPDAPELFAVKVRSRHAYLRSEIKNILLNQNILAGIGNIYASEGLFRSGIHPEKLVKDLSPEQLILVIKKCQQVMFESYTVGGMTVYNFSSFGKKGSGKSKLNVYNKNGLICKICQKGIIQKIEQKDRSTYYCPICQPFEKR